MNHPIKAKPKDMAVDLTKTTYNAIVRKIVGDKLCVSKQVSEDRLEVCKQCDSFRDKDKRCTECGCFMLIKAKLKGVKCPLGKWE